MDTFNSEHNFLEKEIKISDLLNGVDFKFDETDTVENNDESEVDFFSYANYEENLIPFEKPFKELKEQMTEVCKGVWKIVYKNAPENAQQVDFSQHRVTYHRNLYMENEAHPFDSTWMNSKPDVICNDTEKYLEGIIDALSSMKEGEKSYFIITYHKMFKEQGCIPRVLPRADILCDISVLTVEEMGDQEQIKKLQNDTTIKSFDDAKLITEDGKKRAKYFFNNQKMKDALKTYQKVFQMLEFCKTSNDDEKRERNELMVQIMMNMAICNNILEQPAKSLNLIAQIEKLCDISGHSKIQFIKGKALRMNGDYKEAAITLNIANKLRPKNNDVLKELELLEKCMTDYIDIDKKLAENLFIN